MKHQKIYCSVVIFLITGLIVFCQSNKSQILKKNKSVKSKLSKHTLENQNNLSIELDENPKLQKSTIDYPNSASRVSENENLDCNIFSGSTISWDPSTPCNGNCSRYIFITFAYTGLPLEENDVRVHIDSENGGPVELTIDKLEVVNEGENQYKVFGCFDLSPDVYTYFIEINNYECSYSFNSYIEWGGCTDPLAENYNCFANYEEGDCIYGSNCDSITINSNANTLTYKDLWSLSINNDQNTSAFTGNIEVQLQRLSTNPPEIVYIGKTATLSFPPGNNIFDELNHNELGDIDYSETSDVNNAVLQAILQTARAIEGEYEILVFLYDSEGNLCGQDNKTIIVDSRLSPPFLMFPFNGDSIDYPLPFFQWEASTPIENQTNISYSFKMVELLPNQSPQHAIATNYPWHEERLPNLGETELNYLNEARPLEALKTYVWQVAARDTNSLQTAKSEVSIFTYAPPEFEETIQINLFEQYCNNLKPELRINSVLTQKLDKNIDNKFKIRAAISYQPINQIEELLPWQLSVKYEITANDAPDFSQIGIFKIGSSRKHDTYEIFGGKNYLKMDSAQLPGRDIELRIIDYEIFPKGIDLPQNICLELSIEKDKEKRFTEIRDLLISEQIIPNDDAYYLFYRLNPELYDRNLIKLDDLKTPILDEPQVVLSEETIEKSRPKLQNKNEQLKDSYRLLEQKIANANLNLFFGEEHSSKVDSLTQVLEFINALKNGERQISDLSMKFVLYKVNSIIENLDKEKKLSKDEQGFVNLLLKNILEMKTYNDIWHGQNKNKTGYLDEIEKEEVYAMLGAGPFLDNKDIINSYRNSSSSGTYDVKVVVETLSKNETKYHGWRPRFIPGAYDPEKFEKVEKFENPSTATPNFIPVSDIKIWVIREDENKKSKIKDEAIYFDDLLSIIKSYLGGINKDWTPEQKITFRYFELIDQKDD